MLILAMVKGGTSAPWVRWLFVSCVAIWVGIGAFHGLFQFWRHMALYDGALRLIFPNFIHKVL